MQFSWLLDYNPDVYPTFCYNTIKAKINLCNLE